MSSIGNSIAKLAAAASGEEIIEIGRARVRPDRSQYRSKRDEEAQADLNANVKAKGKIDTPLVVIPDPTKEADFLIVSGEGRWIAAGEAGLDTVPCIVRHMTPAEVRRARYDENELRSQPDELDAARALLQMLEEDFGGADRRGAVADLIRATGYKQATVYRRLALLKLPPVLMEAMEEARLSDATLANELAVAHKSDPEGVEKFVQDATKINRTSAAPVIEKAKAKAGKNKGQDGQKALEARVWEAAGHPDPNAEDTKTVDLFDGKTKAEKANMKPAEPSGLCQNLPENYIDALGQMLDRLPGDEPAQKIAMVAEFVETTNALISQRLDKWGVNWLQIQAEIDERRKKEVGAE